MPGMEDYPAGLDNLPLQDRVLLEDGDEDSDGLDPGPSRRITVSTPFWRRSTLSHAGVSTNLHSTD